MTTAGGPLPDPLPPVSERPQGAPSAYSAAASPAEKLQVPGGNTGAVVQGDGNS